MTPALMLDNIEELSDVHKSGDSDKAQAELEKREKVYSLLNDFNRIIDPSALYQLASDYINSDGKKADPLRWKELKEGLAKELKKVEKDINADDYKRLLSEVEQSNIK